MNRDDMRERLKRTFGHWIQFHPTFVDWTGSISAAIMLGVLWRWDEYGDHGWVYKTGKQWWDETRLSERQQRNARRKLKACGLVEERLSGMPAKLYFRIVFPELANKANSIQSDGKKVRTSSNQSAHPSSNQRLEENNIHRKTIKPGHSRPGALSSILPEEKRPEAVIRYAEFTIQQCWHRRAKGSNRNGWKETTLKQWDKAYHRLRETVSSVEVKGVIKWFFEHWNDSIFVPKARTLPAFCEKFDDIKDAIDRERYRQNGEEPTHRRSVINEYDEA